jgi:hypothetical protein
VSEAIQQLEQLVSVLPALQRSISALHDAECLQLGIPVTDIHCIVDAQLTTCVRCEPGNIPTIRISAGWCLNNIVQGHSDLIVYALRRGIKLAHSKLRWTLSQSLKPTALEYVERARQFRLCNREHFSLPVHTFRTRLAVTMLDPMTGEQEIRENIRVEELHDVQKEMAHLLTAKVYAHEQVAELLDTLDAHKAAMREASVESVEIQQHGENHVTETINYVIPS